ncbi:MAG: hypothetical protein AB1486_16740 [Planctomycetota bacterium]
MMRRSSGLLVFLVLSLSACGSDTSSETFGRSHTQSLSGAFHQGGRFPDEASLLNYVYEHAEDKLFRPYKWGDRREDHRMLPAELPPVVIQVDASTRGETYPPILDEVNIWKVYAHFTPETQLSNQMGGRFFNRIAPWWKWARIPAALGGNYTPEVAADCDARRQSAAHDIEPSWECGTPDGQPGIAALNEPVRMGPDGKPSWSFDRMRTSFTTLVNAGLLPHVNISSAHSAFTGGHTFMKWYHWNEEPVRDYALWMDFVEDALRSLDDSTLQDWRFSIINEPNCIRKVKEQHLKVGYRGGPLDYARQYVATARAIRRVVPAARIQVGNYVVSDYGTVERNLHHYLGALKEELAKDPDMAWEDASFYSVSVYDVPHKSLYGADDSKFTCLERFREAVGLAPLPIKVDEFDIHPEIFQKYDSSHPRPFYYTWYSTSWLAKSLAVFRQHQVRSAAPWSDQIFHRDGTWTPTPRYYVLLFDSLLAGSVAVEAEGVPFPVLRLLEPGRSAPRFHSLKVLGGMRPPYHGEGYSYRSVDALASQSEDGSVTRLLLYYDTSILTSDQDTEKDPRPAEVSLRVDHLTPGKYHVALYGIGACLPNSGPEERWIRWDEAKESCRPLLPILSEELEVKEGLGSLHLNPGGKEGPFSLPRHAVLFADIKRL